MCGKLEKLLFMWNTKESGHSSLFYISLTFLGVSHILTIFDVRRDYGDADSISMNRVRIFK